MVPKLVMKNKLHSENLPIYTKYILYITFLCTESFECSTLCGFNGVFLGARYFLLVPVPNTPITTENFMQLSTMILIQYFLHSSQKVTLTLTYPAAFRESFLQEHMFEESSTGFCVEFPAVSDQEKRGSITGTIRLEATKNSTMPAARN